MYSVKVANDFMRRRLVTLSANDDVFGSVAQLLKDNISGAPVVDADNRFLGVFSEKCSMNALTPVVEAASKAGIHVSNVRDFMKCELVTLPPDADVFEAIDHILGRRISGAPVVTEAGEYQGIFSEKTALKVLVGAIHDQLPGTHVRSYMNCDRNRLIDDEDTLLDVAHKFQSTPYRRLPILHGRKLAGQVSRRDVLRAEHRVMSEVVARAKQDSADASVKQAADPKQVEDYLDREALTITPETDLLSIAQMFLNSPYRRLPVVEDQQLVGQVSRRDVLESAAEALRPKPIRNPSATLYLSPLADSAPPSLG